MEEERKRKTSLMLYQKEEKEEAKTEKKNVLFQTEFDQDAKDTTTLVAEEIMVQQKEDILKKAKMFDYNLKFASDYLVSGWPPI